MQRNFGAQISAQNDPQKPQKVRSEDLFPQETVHELVCNVIALYRPSSSVERNNGSSTPSCGGGALTTTKAIVYVNTRRKVDWLAEKTTERGFTVSAMPTPFLEDREACRIIMREFRSMLITDDILWTDAPSPPSIINYDVPANHET
jgi:hypothetical protein